MAQTAAHLADHVIPLVLVRQWVISVPKRLRGMLADRPAAVSALTKIFIAEIERLLLRASGVAPGADTLSASRPPCAIERLYVSRGPDGRITRIRYVLPRRRAIHWAANWVGPGRGRKSTRPGANGVVDWAELVQAHDDRDVSQASPDELRVIDIHSLCTVPDARSRRSPQAAGLGETLRTNQKTAAS